MGKFAFKTILFALTLGWLSSCVGLKTGSNGNTAPGLIKVFSKGKDSLLCHAGPVMYTPVNCNDDLEIDYTYLKVKDHSNAVVCNFSLVSKDATFRPESVTIQVNEKRTTVNQLEKFFAEGYGKKEYKFRYSFQVSDSLFYDMMNTESLLISVNDRAFKGGKDHRKKSNLIFRAVLFDLYN
jgi:hypothetical protein